MKKNVTLTLFEQAEDALNAEALEMLERIQERLIYDDELNRENLIERVKTCKAVLRRISYRRNVMRGSLPFAPTALCGYLYLEQTLDKAKLFPELSELNFDYHLEFQQCFSELVVDKLQFTQTLFMILSFAIMQGIGGSLFLDLVEDDENMNFRFTRRGVTVLPEEIETLNLPAEKYHKKSDFIVDEKALIIAALKENVTVHKQKLSFVQNGDDFEIILIHPKKHYYSKKYLKENRKIKVPVEMIMETELLAVRYERDKIYVK